jgi:outer membrane autotransporter protein
LQPVDQTSEQISANLDRNLNNVDNRITNLVTPSLFGDLSGIGAGDAATRYGVWISPFVGSSLRKKNGNSPKSSTKFYGASIGIDTAINDDLMLGAAITPMHTDSKFSGAKTGSKGKINSLLLSLYGYRQLGNNWYLSGVFCGGQNKVKQQEHRILTSSITEIARSSYDVKSFSTQFTIGYNYKLSDSLVVIPVGGLGYYWIDSASYTETGTTLTNLKAKRGSAYIAEAVFGLQMAYAGKIKDTNVTPEVHAYVSYDFKRKESAIHATLQNFTTALPLSAHKYSKVYYNIGTEINAESPSKKFEYGVSYEAELTKHSSTHTGALKIKVLF